MCGVSLSAPPRTHIRPLTLWRMTTSEWSPDVASRSCFLVSTFIYSRLLLFPFSPCVCVCVVSFLGTTDPATAAIVHWANLGRPFLLSLSLSHILPTRFLEIFRFVPCSVSIQDTHTHTSTSASGHRQGHLTHRHTQKHKKFSSLQSRIRRASTLISNGDLTARR